MVKKSILILSLGLSLFGKEIPIIDEKNSVKGVMLNEVSIIVDNNSELQKDLTEVLLKHKKVELAKTEINLPPIVVVSKSDKEACASCHGESFEKNALGKLKIVKDMKEDDILKALQGYKNDSYGGAMKSIMKAQLSEFSEGELIELAKIIKGI